jgi:hypothetical protein
MTDPILIIFAGLPCAKELTDRITMVLNKRG